MVRYTNTCPLLAERHIDEGNSGYNMFSGPKFEQPKSCNQKVINYCLDCSMSECYLVISDKKRGKYEKVSIPSKV